MSDGCTDCGTALRANARFCDACGTPVAGSPLPAEYKQVTVLFADVVHSMDIAAAVGAERLREIMTELFHRSSMVVKRYGGTVDKFTGDGVMAVFGAPRALEDHALRACMAALDIQSEVSTIADAVKTAEDIEFRLRIGLNSGEVIAGEIGSGPTGYTTIGEQVGLAQRMESVAPPGGVMLSESTVRLVEGATEVGEPQKVLIKGAAAPVVARQLLAMAPQQRQTWRRMSRLVGRDWEATTVAGLLEMAACGSGRIAGLVGPPGIGKSRLVSETVTRAAQRGIDVFITYCESHTSDIPFLAVSRLLRDIFDIGDLTDKSARESIRARMPDADPEDLVLLDDLLGIRSPDVPMPSIDPAARGRRIAVLLNEAAIARSTPAVFVVEDAHWIDDVSEQMIAEFAAVVPQTPLLLLLTYRPEYGGALDHLPRSHRIALEPLNDSDCTTLAAEVLGADPSVAALVEHICARAAGNPFFVEEMVRDLAEREVIVGQPGAYIAHRDATSVRIPASLHATIAARVDRLGPAAKRTLNAASVIGMRFDSDLLSGLVETVELGDLIHAELVDRVSFSGRVEYAFRHPLIRAVAYESQLKSDRASLHRRLADAIKQRASTDENAALIAEHLEAAGDLRDAFDWHMRAGNWSQARDIRAARVSWQRARDVADRIPGEGPAEVAMRIHPRTLLSVNMLRFGGSVEETGLDELRELCAVNGDKLSLAIGMGGTVAMLVLHYRLREAAKAASDLVELLEDVEHPGKTVSLWAIAANATIQSGDVIEGMRLAQRAIDAAGGDPGLEDVFSSPVALGFAMRGTGRLALGLAGWREDFECGVAMCRPPEPAHVAALLFKVCVGMYNGAIAPDATTLTQTAEALRSTERSGDGFAFDSARLCRGIALVTAGGAHLAEGLGTLDAYREASLRHGYSGGIVRFVDAQLAREKARMGDLDGAVELARQAVDPAYSAGDVLTCGPAVTVLVESLLARGTEVDIAEAEAAIHRLATAPTDRGFVLYELPLLRMRALLARVDGDDDRYRQFADRYRRMAADLGFEGHMAVAATM